MKVVTFLEQVQTTSALLYKIDDDDDDEVLYSDCDPTHPGLNKV